MSHHDYSEHHFGCAPETRPVAPRLDLDAHRARVRDRAGLDPDPLGRPADVRQQLLAEGQRGRDHRPGDPQLALRLPRQPALRQRRRRRGDREPAARRREVHRPHARGRPAPAGDERCQSAARPASRRQLLRQRERDRPRKARQRPREQDGLRHLDGKRRSHDRPARARHRARPADWGSPTRPSPSSPAKRA